MVMVVSEVFVTQKTNHIFKVGDVLELTGLVGFPEYNGETVTITNYRLDGPDGLAYYFTSNCGLEKHLNWIYEFRLKKP